MDVAAPVNILIRADAIIRVVDDFGVVDADGSMVAIGPGRRRTRRTHFGDTTAPADRRGIVLNHLSLQDGSRWV
jgi:hypothetical protein